jgi:hypothetical protein
MRLLIYQRNAPSLRAYGLLGINSSFVFIEEVDGGILYPPVLQDHTEFEGIERFNDLVAISESWLAEHPFRYEIVLGKDLNWFPM